jgi:hypothetical protein
MTRHCVEHRLFVVHLDAIDLAGAGAGDDFGDCRHLRRVEILRPLDLQPVLARPPLGDVA